MNFPSLDDALFASMDSSVRPLAEAESLPPVCYTPGRNSMSSRRRRCSTTNGSASAAKRGWPRRGDYFTTSIVGEPIVVARTRAGELKAMSSVCQHRGMLVAEGCGNARGFLCPYHHWTYGLDGELVNAPAMERTHGFDKRSIRLPQFKVEVWLGFIFINFDERAAPLAPRLTAWSRPSRPMTWPPPPARARTSPASSPGTGR